MEIVRADWIEKIDLEQELDKLTKKSGLLSKRSLDTLETYKILYRPYKRVKLNIVSPIADETQSKYSLIDAELAPLVNDDDHRLLLWRPKYIEYNTSTEENIEEPMLDIQAIQSVIDDMMEQRWHSQEYDEEVRPKLRRLQADPLSTISIILPRTPGGLRKERVLIEDRKATHAYILATSLVTNTSTRDIITSVDIENTIYVETIIATYVEENGSHRLLFFETPGTNSIKEAAKLGRALGRLCDLYGDCRDILSKTP